MIDHEHNMTAEEIIERLDILYPSATFTGMEHSIDAAKKTYIRNSSTAAILDYGMEVRQQHAYLASCGRPMEPEDKYVHLVRAATAVAGTDGSKFYTHSLRAYNHDTQVTSLRNMNDLYNVLLTQARTDNQPDAPAPASNPYAAHAAAAHEDPDQTPFAPFAAHAAVMEGYCHTHGKTQDGVRHNSANCRWPEVGHLTTQLTAPANCPNGLRPRDEHRAPGHANGRGGANQGRGHAGSGDRGNRGGRGGARG